MWPFTNQKTETVSHLEQYETLTKRIIDVSARVTALELNEEAFRNKVLRKVQKAKEEPEDISTERPGIIGYGNNTESKQIWQK